MCLVRNTTKLRILEYPHLVKGQGKCKNLVTYRGKI